MDDHLGSCQLHLAHHPFHLPPASVSRLALSPHPSSPFSLPPRPIRTPSASVSASHARGSRSTTLRPAYSPPEPPSSPFAPSSSPTPPPPHPHRVRSSMSAATMDGGKPSSKVASVGKKAWQGPNPITAKTSPSSLSNGDKPLPKLPQQTQQARVDRHAHDRLSYLFAHMVGYDAVLTLKNGEQFVGVFSGCSVDAHPHQYLLKMVRRTRSPNQQQTNGATDTSDEYIGEGADHAMTFDVQDTADLNINDLGPLAAAPKQNGTSTYFCSFNQTDDVCPGSISSSFRTDTEISARGDASMPRERELQRWDASTADSSIDMSLEAGGSSSWDQFAVNERMYGVQTDYDENIYTTSIDRSDPLYKQREAAAARMAKEIEGSATTDAHVAEERGVRSDRDDELDEEDKYSGVRREAAAPLPKRTAGAYVPPSQRSITGVPTVPGAPFDPAIISSQLAKPTPPPPNATSANQPAQAVTPMTEVPEPSVSEASQSSRAQSGSRAPSQQPQKRPAEQTTEDHMRNVADAFKQFSSNEKFRVKQAQEAKRANARQEKNVRLNDLKKFAESFKLKSRVPDDLVPILAKDRDKQKEIQHKAEEAAKEAELKAEERKKSGSSMTSSSLSSIANGHIDGVTGSGGAEQRVAAFNQHNRLKAQQHRPVVQSQTQTPRGQIQHRMHQGGPMFSRNGAPGPSDIRIPTGPAAGPPSADRVPLSPSSATSARLNVNAFEFRPAASTFTPAGASPSPQRPAAVTEQRKASAAEARFFSKERKASSSESNGAAIIFNSVRRMMDGKHAEEHKKAIAANGGVPKPWFTAPTWFMSTENASVSYKDLFPKLPAASSSQGPSPLHTPNPVAVSGPMPHSHQLPHHLQAPAQMGTPNHRPPFYAPANQHGQPPFAPPMPQFGPNGSVQNSPRFPQAQMAFNNQMPPHMTNMGPFPGQPMPPYGISPTLAYRQPQMPMAMGGGVVMAPQPQGQSKYTDLKRHQDGGGRAETDSLTVPHMRPNFPQGPQMMPQMGTQMMMSNPAGGGYMNGPGMPQQGYSPMPMHAQPAGNFPHMQPGHGTPAGYSASPRPPIMQHSGSHQGFQLQMSGHMPGAPFGPNPGGPPHMHYPRQMSGQGYPQMTPRQQHAQVAPPHPSPGMGQGDEGK